MAFYSTKLSPLGTGMIRSTTSSGALVSAGNSVLNLESLSGLATCGLLMIRGNENNVNATTRIYMFNTALYGPTGVRYGQLKILGDKQHGNNYGNVYAYFSNYASSWATGDQTISGTATSTLEVYFRNLQGAPCAYEYTLWRTG
jgi:hypothetical protein